jgi:hypothetical protein
MWSSKYLAALHSRSVANQQKG